MIVFRRAVQIGCLLAFLFLLATAGLLGESDLFLRMDPSLVGITVIAGRILSWAFLPALVVLISAPLMGRVFCGYICPMGTTIDASDACLGTKRRKTPGWLPSPNLKIYILTFLTGAAILGISFASWATPLSLITRFYGLVIYPVIRLFSDNAITVLYPVADRLDIHTLMFLDISTRQYAAQFFVLLFFIAVFAAVRISPRFWCRYLCPAGAMLALAGNKPLIRRQVGTDCDGCGKCTRACPMGAINKDHPEATRHGDCLSCRTCENTCPQEAIRFSTEHRPITADSTKVSVDRRRVIISGITGAGVAAVGLTGLTTVTSEKAEGQVRTARLIRPPGALPESDFLWACVRCGQCMVACPTNTLQPVWFAAGAIGMFSPAITPQRKYCDPKCTACGEVCPTNAIQPLSARQRVWAKTGTAIIYRRKCLAWEYRKKCMVCDEVCPYDAVEFEKKPDLPHPVPHVLEDRCAGCGYCEYFCPVQNDKAIVVTPMDELRLKDGTYEETGRSRGFKLELRPEEEAAEQSPYSYPEDGPETPSDGGMAPGFDEGL